uniref:Uncharacterized protein n=1 Tax=Globodera rostochiensis TaxID=31243 RepID=A0A914HLL7_GLORO
MEQAVENVQSSAINLMQNLDQPNILPNIRQEIVQNSFLDEKNKEKMEKLLEHFQIGIDKFYAIIKVRNATMLQRRRKRMDSLNIESGEGGGRTNDRNVNLKACIFTMVIGLFAIGMGTFFATRSAVPGDDATDASAQRAFDQSMLL